MVVVHALAGDFFIAKGFLRDISWYAPRYTCKFIQPTTLRDQFISRAPAQLS